MEMKQLKRLICFSLTLVLTTGISAMAIDISALDGAEVQFKDDVNYMAEMLEACVDGSEDALLLGAQAEMKRNLKIRELDLTFDETAFFPEKETAEEIAAAIGDYLTELSKSAAEDGEELETIQYVVIATTLNFREGPGVEYNKLGSFAYGTILTLLEIDEESGWFRVTDGQSSGWVKDTYLLSYDGTNFEVPTDYTEEDLYWLALAIQMEAGSNWLSDEHQKLVGNVILNRVASASYPGSIYDVLHQPSQYPWATRGTSVEPSERAYANAKSLLEGERLCPENVLYQSTVTQGSGVYTSIYDATLNSTTYFCYY